MTLEPAFHWAWRRISPALLLKPGCLSLAVGRAGGYATDGIGGGPLAPLGLVFRIERLSEVRRRNPPRTVQAIRRAVLGSLRQ